jgi:hypothetical protein
MMLLRRHAQPFLRDAGANERSGLAFRIENCGDGIAVSLANYHYNLALAVLVPDQTAITAMCFDISATAKI